jgi:hypothetical protein
MIRNKKVKELILPICILEENKSSQRKKYVSFFGCAVSV